MCGIVALIRAYGTVNKEVEDIFYQLWWATQLRGTDGSGLMQINQAKAVNLFKSAYTPDYAATEKQAHSIIRNTDVNPFTVGHCRAATKRPAKFTEDVMKRQAHPFKHGNISLVHNGYFSYVGKEHQDSHDVDSESFCKAASELGFKEALEESTGAYALIAYDSAIDRLIITRNSDRPLWRFDTYAGHWFVSEKELGLWILSRNKVTVQKVEEVPVMKMYSYKAFDLTPEVSEVEKKTYSSYSSFPASRHHYFDDYYGESIAAPVSESDRYEQVTKEEVIHLADKFVYYDWKRVAEKRLLSHMSSVLHPRIADDWKANVASIKLKTGKVVPTLPERIAKKWAPKETVSEPAKVLPFRPTETGTTLTIQEQWDNGSLKGIYNNDGFRITVGSKYVFAVEELHEHKGFVGVVGRVPHPSVSSRVRIMGNIHGLSTKVIKESKKMLEAIVTNIHSRREKGIRMYTVGFKEAKLADVFDVQSFRSEPVEKGEKEPDKKVIAIADASALDSKQLTLDDLVKCPGCNNVFNKKDRKKFTKARDNGTITVEVCPTCFTKCVNDFDGYYRSEYVPNRERVYQEDMAK